MISCSHQFLLPAASLENINRNKKIKIYMNVLILEPKGPIKFSDIFSHVIDRTVTEKWRRSNGKFHAILEINNFSFLFTNLLRIAYVSNKV